MTKRREFPASVKREASERSQGVCESHLMSADIQHLFPACCTEEAREFDHIEADCLGGEPTLENCAHLCRTCHAIKTGTDRKYQAKRRRHTIDREKRAKRKTNPSPKIRTRGFNKTLKRKFDGSVVSRD